MYHNVYKNGTDGIISTEEFEKHMSYIKDKKTFKMEELKNLNYKLPKNSILVTFDDGYKNNYTEAFPILKKYGIKATIFINTKYIGNSKDYLNWDEIREMYNSGLVDFQLHTHSHGLTIRKIEIKGFFTNETVSFIKGSIIIYFTKMFMKMKGTQKRWMGFLFLRQEVKLLGRDIFLWIIL